MIDHLCPNCGESIVVLEEMVGSSIPCPRCGAVVTIEDRPADEEVPSAIIVEDADIAEMAGDTLTGNELPREVGHRQATKLCYYCAEPIAEAAIKCKHCGEFLDAEVPPGKEGIQTIEATGKILEGGNFGWRADHVRLLCRNRGIPGIRPCPNHRGACDHNHCQAWRLVTSWISVSQRPCRAG